jgi:hypothetical protein
MTENNQNQPDQPTPVTFCPHGLNAELSCVYCEAGYPFESDTLLRRLANHLYGSWFGLIEGGPEREKPEMPKGEVDQFFLNAVAKEAVILGALAAGAPFTYDQIAAEMDQVNDDEHDA